MNLQPFHLSFPFVAVAAGAVSLAFLPSITPTTVAGSASGENSILEIEQTSDFVLTGDGSSEQWNRAKWIDIPRRRGEGTPMATRAKLMYSAKGLYCLIDCADRAITVTMTEDFNDLWNEDVVELFLWPEETFPVYFEYELSPLGYELPIIVPNNKGNFWGWLPWHYEGERRIRKATAVRGGVKESGAKIEGWTAEFFIPYALLKPLGRIPPQPGATWRGNIYRLDYDTGKSEAWAWQPVEGTFHDIAKFGTFVFK